MTNKELIALWEKRERNFEENSIFTNGEIEEAKFFGYLEALRTCLREIKQQEKDQKPMVSP